jgi:hypothetical protein
MLPVRGHDRFGSVHGVLAFVGGNVVPVSHPPPECVEFCLRGKGFHLGGDVDFVNAGTVPFMDGEEEGAGIFPDGPDLLSRNQLRHPVQELDIAFVAFLELRLETLRIYRSCAEKDRCEKDCFFHQAGILRHLAPSKGF